jgi:hypothetical protein
VTVSEERDEMYSERASERRERRKRCWTDDDMTHLNHVLIYMRTLSVSASFLDTDSLDLSLTGLEVSLKSLMDPKKTPQLNRNSRFFDAPLNSVRDFASRTFKSLAPHIFSILAFCFLVPVIIAISIFSGYLVWRNVAVGWESPLYLQYGYVNPIV